MALDADVANHYPFPLTSPRFRYALKIEGRPFLDSVEPVGVDLPALGVGTATLPVRFTYASLWSIVQQLLTANHFSYSIDCTLLLSGLTRSFELPLSYSGSAPILRPPILKDLGVPSFEVSLTRAVVTEVATIENPNVFPLGIRQVGFRMKIGSFDVGGLTATTDNAIPAGGRGSVTLRGEITAGSAVSSLLRGQSLGDPHIELVGSVETPFGMASLR